MVFKDQRRALHGLLLLLAVVLLIGVACAPAAAPSPAATAAKATEAPKATEASKPAEAPKPAATSAATGDWDTVLAAAKKEGSVVVAGPPGATYRDAMSGFEQKYPDIKLQFEGFTPPAFVARFTKERDAGQNLWDVYITGPTTFDITGKKAGYFLPVKPALLLPEVLDEKVWLEGFNKLYLDNEKQYVFAFQAEIEPEAYVNRDFIKESELSAVRGLVDPKWKGKIGMYDPRVDGSGSARLAFWMTFPGGEDFVRSLLKQDVVVSADDRQQAEWIVRGQYPIGVGVGEAELVDFKKQGLGNNIVPLGNKKDPDAWRLSTAYGGVRLISKPPHENAAKVFLNWLLSKDGQTAWVEKAGRGSRRLDVPRIPNISPEPDVSYSDLDHEDTLNLRDKAKALAQELLK